MPSGAVARMFRKASLRVQSFSRPGSPLAFVAIGAEANAVVEVSREFGKAALGKRSCREAVVSIQWRLRSGKTMAPYMSSLDRLSPQSHEGILKLL
jgi:hypothetical protein